MQKGGGPGQMPLERMRSKGMGETACDHSSGHLNRKLMLHAGELQIVGL